ncbi:GNAT family protein [Georgenia halophila]|uniref:GNAT family protein n=1 Tax=Georgenia halophila TaxID=620889 RepID=A0ABP8LC72_9MICO
MLTLEEIWPPYALRVTCGDLEMRTVREADVPELVDLVLDGVHPIGSMPFYFPWTAAPREELPANYLRFVSGLKANFDTGSPSLELVVRRVGEVVGMQGFGGKDFKITRTGETGSWLAMRHQGRGIGTRMRQMICAFAFDVLGAEEITSGAFEDNPASLAVSRKVGYRPNGTRRLSRQGTVAVLQDLVLTPEDFVRGEPVTVEGTEPLLRFLELDV